MGLRLGVRKTGCSGFAYVVNYADEIGADDVVFEQRWRQGHRRPREPAVD
jgi:iron-sulfur cluster assembly protein